MPGYKKKYGKKRFAPKRRHTRISRPVRNGENTVSIKCECFNAVELLNGQNRPSFVLNSLQYWNLQAALASSDSFINAAGLYMRYKITGISLRFDSILTWPTTSVPSLPICYVAFFPGKTSQSLGNTVLFNDKAATFSCAATSPQTKYWRFPNNYFTASTGGIGTWNDVNSYASITGQLSLDSVAVQANASARTTVAEIRMIVYVQFSSRQE